MNDRADDLRLRLDDIAEELAELSIDVLREAIEQGAQKRPVEEKTYSQARRAVEKASRLLESLVSGTT